MGGGRSIQLARVLGVRIGVDPSWFIVLFLVIWSLSGSFKNVYPGHDTKAFFLATLAIWQGVALLVLSRNPLPPQLEQARAIVGERVEVIPISSAESGRPAPRPANSTLTSVRWEAAGFPSLRPWQEALAQFVESLG